MFRLVLLGISCVLLAACAVSNTSAPETDAKAPEVVATTACAGNSYKVVRNDTLSQIARKCKVRMQDLARANNLEPPYLIYPNQILNLPGSSGVSAYRWDFPVNTYSSYKFVAGSYGVKSLEIYGQKGAAVYAVEAGEVIFSSLTNSEFGKMVMVRHADGYMTIYAHNSNLLVRKGEQVKQGQIIANLGNTGETQVPKLLFEVRLNGKKVSADKFIQPR